jgi:hypothetical protein
VGTPRGLQGLRNRLFFCFWVVRMLLPSPHPASGPWSG